MSGTTLGVPAALLIAILLFQTGEASQCTKHKTCLSCVSSKACVWYTLDRFEGFCDDPSVHENIYQFKAVRPSSCARVDQQHNVDAPSEPEKPVVLPILVKQDKEENRPFALPSVTQQKGIEKEMMGHICSIYALTHEKISSKMQDINKTFKKCIRRWK